MRKKAQKIIQIVTHLTNHFWLCLAEVRENYGHDDTLPYQAEVYIFDREATPGRLVFTHIGHIWNDGWGGDSNFEPIDRTEETQKLIARTREECAKHQMFWNGSPLGSYTLEEVCDDLAEVRIELPKQDKNLVERTLVYVLDDNPSIKAYGGNVLVYNGKQKFTYDD